MHYLFLEDLKVVVRSHYSRHPAPNDFLEQILEQTVYCRLTGQLAMQNHFKI